MQAGETLLVHYYLAAESPAPVLIFKDLAAGLQSVATAVALLVGGVWAYYKFFRSRTFVPRLEGAIEATAADRDGSLFLDVTIRLKNVGLTRLDIIQTGSGLRLYSHDADPATRPYRDVPWHRWNTMDVFTAHEWIEPSEFICDRLLIYLGDTRATAYKLELRLVAGKEDADPPAHNFVQIVIPEATGVPNGDGRPNSGRFELSRSAFGIVAGRINWERRTTDDGRGAGVQLLRGSPEDRKGKEGSGEE